MPAFQPLRKYYSSLVKLYELEQRQPFRIDQRFYPSPYRPTFPAYEATSLASVLSPAEKDTLVRAIDRLIPFMESDLKAALDAKDYAKVHAISSMIVRFKIQREHLAR